MPRAIAIQSRPTKFDRFKLALAENPSESPTDIAFRIYDCKHRRVAACIAGENLRKLHITMPILMDRLGISDEKIIKKLDNLMGAEKTTRVVCDKQIQEFVDADGDLQLSATQLACRLKGHLKEKNGNGIGQMYMIFGDATFQQLQTLPTDELISRLAQELAKR